MKRSFIVDLLLALLLTACSTQPIAVPTVGSTAVPVLTPIASTKTPSSPTSTLDIIAQLAPEGQPASQWDGIPIMPGATTGEGDAEGYVFTVKATLQQVKEFYDLELGKLGWQPLSIDQEDSSLTLMFMNNASVTLTISVVTKGDEALVLLAK